MTKKITESLVNKKPATAAKLFAEEMETRLDEISKKTLGRYIMRALDDRDRHIEDAAEARASADALNNVRAGSDAAAMTKMSLRSHLGDLERSARDKKYKRESGIVRAVNRLTKEDLDEDELNEISKKEGKFTGFKKDDHSAGKISKNKAGKKAIFFNTIELAQRKKDKLTKEDLDEVEAPANFWNAGMSKMNPIKVSQKQPAEPGQFKATLSKSPTRLADRDSQLQGTPRDARAATTDEARSRGPKEIELTGDWQADLPDHSFDPKLDSETEFYPLFSQFKSLGAYPSGPPRAWEEADEEGEELNEISKKMLGKYIDAAASKLGGEAYTAGGGTGLGKEGKNKAFRKAVNRLNGIRRAGKKLSEEDKKKVLDSLDEGKLPQKGTAEYHQHRIAKDTVKNPSKALLGGPSVEEAKKILKDKFGYTEDQVRKLSEETLQEGLFDPAKQPLLALWDEHARRSDAHGSGSRSEILKRIEDHVAKKHGQEGLKKMRLHTDLTNALKHSLSPDKGHLQSILGNMRSRCSMEA